MGRTLVFALNGERVELAAVDPRTTLLQYIRSQPGLQGTKLGCGEGGCGACTVLLSKYDAATERVEESTINSCLALLCSVDGCAVTTTEGLTTAKNGCHAVHKRLAGFHGSQCGFCTPGMSMAIYGGLRNAATKTETPCHGHKSLDASHGSSAGMRPITALAATKAINGNICRCTGYRPILDVCKSFAGDVDVEDLGLNSFWESKQKANAALLPPYYPEEDPQFPRFLIDELKSRSQENSPSNSLSFDHVEGREGATVVQRQWLTASSLSNALDLFKSYGNGKQEVKFVVGNTSAGVYKNIHPEVYIDISHIPELFVVKATGESLEVGAGLPLTKLIGLLDPEKSKCKNVVYGELAKHVRQIASEQVRNRASVGGNLILAQKLGFDSDLATILLGAGAEVTVACAAKGQSTVSLEEFLSRGGLEPEGRILISVRIPSWSDLSKGAKLLFKTYRISCRPSGNAVSYINAAFLAVVDLSALVIKTSRLAFGAWGGAHAVRAGKTEKLLEGKSLTPAGLLEAIEVLKTEINPPPTVHKSAYRRSVAVGFLFDFFNSSLLSPGSAPPADREDEDDAAVGAHTTATNVNLFHSLVGANSPAQIPAVGNGTLSNGTIPAVGNGTPSNGTIPAVGNGALSKGTIPAVSNGTLSSGTIPAVGNGTLSNGTPQSELERDTHVVEFGSRTKSSQKFATSTEFWPINQPTEKSLVLLQASGEAVFVDDITPAKGTLYAAYVLSDKRPGKIVSIDSAEALKSPGAVDFLSVKDIPGKNIGYTLFGITDRLFAEDKVECRNDNIGLLVADSYEHAREAASKIKVNVEEGVGSVYTIDEAIAKESYGDLGFLSHLGSTCVGESPVKADYRIENGEVYSGSQYYFYMETQSAYAILDEDKCLTVYSANQAPNEVQKVISTVLGIPMNSVRVITRRCGGAFGGKWGRACMVAVACALAAYKLKRPVKLSLDRETDMRMCMGRHEFKALYNVDFNDDGKIVGLQANLYLHGGRTKDPSFLVLHGVVESLKLYDWGYLRLENKICKTDTVSRSIMRGPGDIQGHFFAETVTEHVAAYLGIDAWKVRERNMHSVGSLGKFFAGNTDDADSYTLPYIWQKLKDQSQFATRRLAVRKFNESSRWEKRGIDIVAGIYSTGFIPKGARVSVFEDGSVVVEVGGIEMGQGLWTKVQQAVSHGLSKLWGSEAHPLERVGMSMVRVVQNDSISLPNQATTGGSTTSEVSCLAALKACEILVESLKPYLAKRRESGATPVSWEAIVQMALAAGVILSAQGNYNAPVRTGYLNFGVCVSEVSINVLTGSTSILQTDLLYDCGRSLNPAVDIGQIEGAFMMGVGFYLTEELTEEEGKLTNTGTWDYKPPTADNIPKRFNVELSNTKPNKERILSSKASGEPPILLAKSAHSAVRNAIAAAREDLLHLPVFGTNQKMNGIASNLKAGGGGHFRLDTPASIDKVKTLCGLDNVERYLASLASLA